MTKKAINSILFLLLLASIACSSADYAAALHIDYEPEQTSSLLVPEATSTMTMPARATATNSPSWRVCTGVENGTLRVRSAPGVDGKVIFTLSENQNVCLPGATSETQKTDDGATWVKITDPEGWVNARYICENKK